MKNKFLKYCSLFALAFVLNMTSVNVVEAQCPMCKLSAEQNLKDGGTAGKGLNAGILYMFSAPYLLVGGIAYFWWINRKQEEDDDEFGGFSNN
ncbi:MAG: hypothetical protein AB8F94_00920 [Saprospiraceae bacterium]